jgi:chromate transporter
MSTRPGTDSSFSGDLYFEWSVTMAVAVWAGNRWTTQPHLGMAASRDQMKAWLQILILFGSLSLLSIGGGNSVLPEMHQRSVNDYRWLTDNQFADVFAISQAAPGPSILIVTLIGYKAAGIFGAFLATAAVIIPAGALVYLVSRFWERAARSPIRIAIERGFAPLTVGLVLATAYILGRSTEHDWRSYLLTATCAGVFIFTKVNPLIVVAAAGLAGFLGWLG